MDKQARAQKRLEEFAGPAALRIWWLVAIVVGICLSFWLAYGAADFLSELLEWMTAFARVLLPMLIAISIAGLIATALQARLGPNLALAAFFVLIFATAIGTIELASRVPASASISGKQAAIEGYWRSLRGQPHSSTAVHESGQSK